MMDKFDDDARPIPKRHRKYVKASQTYLAAKKCTTERSAGQSLKGAHGLQTSTFQNSSLKESTSPANAQAVKSPLASLKPSAYAPADKLPVQNLEISVPTVGESKDSSQQTLNSANQEGSQESPVTPQMDVSSTGAGPSLPTDDISLRNAIQLRITAFRGLLSAHPSALDGLDRLCTGEARKHVFCYLCSALVDILSASPESPQGIFDLLKGHAVDLEVLGFQTGWILEYVAELECSAAARKEVLRSYEAKKRACDEFEKKVAEQEAELASEKKKIAERENELAKEKKKIAKRENELANNKKKIAELETELADEQVMPQPPAPFPY